MLNEFTFFHFFLYYYNKVMNFSDLFMKIIEKPNLKVNYQKLKNFYKDDLEFYNAFEYLISKKGNTSINNTSINSKQRENN